MSAVEEYRTYAEYCRLLAKKNHKPEYTPLLQEMAQMWEKLAKHRERDLEAEPNLP